MVERIDLLYFTNWFKTNDIGNNKKIANCLY